nr:hypothetical protein [Tanacetum cinerariifolium]
INQKENHILGPSTVAIEKKLKAIIQKDKLTIAYLEGVMDIYDEAEFKIHKNGYFEFHPLRQVQPRPSGIVIREGGLMNVQADVGVPNNKQHVLSMVTCVVKVEVKRVDGDKVIVLGLRAFGNP